MGQSVVITIQVLQAGRLHQKVQNLRVGVHWTLYCLSVEHISLSLGRLSETSFSLLDVSENLVKVLENELEDQNDLLAKYQIFNGIFGRSHQAWGQNYCRIVVCHLVELTQGNYLLDEEVQQEHYGYVVLQGEQRHYALQVANLVGPAPVVGQLIVHLIAHYRLL